MSKFEELQTEIRSTRFLGEALSIIGHAPEMHPDGITIKDYDGKALSTAGRGRGAKDGKLLVGLRIREDARTAAWRSWWTISTASISSARSGWGGCYRRTRSRRRLRRRGQEGSLSRPGSDADRRRASDPPPVRGPLAAGGKEMATVSKCEETSTELRNETHLVAALCDLGFRPRCTRRRRVAGRL